jgi:hypothetical protein
MYFLNGDRIYIKPENGSSSPENQLNDCLSQLDRINSGKKIFKLNFFVDTSSGAAYKQLQKKLEELVSRRFQTPVICGLIAQPPLTCRILVEAFYYDATQWKNKIIISKNGAAMLFQRDNARVLVGHAQAQSSAGCSEDTTSAFKTFGGLLEEAGLPVQSVMRQWNYIENITGYDGEKQRYQEFNNVRADFYGKHFNKTGFPAATGIGMNRGGIIIEFVAVDSPEAVSLPLNNPEQTAAHSYSEKVLVGNQKESKATPKFERARYLELFGKKQVFVSGTAAIRGEKTRGIGDPVKQTEITIQNMLRLYSKEMLSAIPGNSLQPKYGHARVYVKHRKDYVAIKKTFKQHYGNLPVVYIIADICREDLLVEIEGKVILE